MDMLHFFIVILFVISISIYVVKNSSIIDYIILVSFLGVAATFVGLLYSLINYNKSKKQLDKHSDELNRQINLLKDINETNKREIIMTVSKQLDGLNQLQAKSISIKDYINQFAEPYYTNYIDQTSNIFREDIALTRDPENGHFSVQPESLRTKYNDVLEHRPSEAVFSVGDTTEGNLYRNEESSVIKFRVHKK